MKRFWASWYSHEQPEALFQYWITGLRMSDDAQIYCAVIDTKDEPDVWTAVMRHFPDYEPRFCDEKEKGWRPPADRFPGWEGKTIVGHTVKPAPAFQPPQY